MRLLPHLDSGFTWIHRIYIGCLVVVLWPERPWAPRILHQSIPSSMLLIYVHLFRLKLFIWTVLRSWCLISETRKCLMITTKNGDMNGAHCRSLVTTWAPMASDEINSFTHNEGILYRGAFWHLWYAMVIAAKHSYHLSSLSKSSPWF